MTDKITIERETLAGMIYPPKPPPRLCGYIPDGSGVEWNAYDTMQMEAYARAAYADGFAAALAAPPAPAAVPPGYALVPVEPTDEMLAAMQSSGWMVGNYRAMIAAAGKTE